MKEFIDYTCFLKDKKFIQWQLTPDNELDAYWREFILKHPHREGDLQRAINYIKTTGLNKRTLTDEERQQLFNKIEATIEANNKKLKTKRLIQYVAASCAAIVVLVLATNLYLTTNKKAISVNKEEVIVGNMLGNKDIQLITGESHISFDDNIDVLIDEKGTTKILQNNNQSEKTIKVIPSTLNKLIVPYGKRSTLTLADGSRVWLNSGTVLEFPAQFTGNSREIRLESGEMYIEVAPNKNKSFHVCTSGFNVKVYGTKFNVSNYANSPQSVVLVEGRVSLQSANKREMFLSPNEQAVYSNNGTFNTLKVNVSEFTSWKNGYLLFDKTPMTDVLMQIERYYNLSFDYDKVVNFHKCTCRGKIYLSENLYDVMTTITLLTSTAYETKGNRIYITNNESN